MTSNWWNFFDGYTLFHLKFANVVGFSMVTVSNQAPEIDQTRGTTITYELEVIQGVV